MAKIQIKLDKEKKYGKNFKIMIMYSTEVNLLRDWQSI